ncbi:MAG: DUF5117 domain-containing protein [Planctomycetes bacterium]|nr:DUF5117 domain-containing protein [Planctomycetota bacterium]
MNHTCHPRRFQAVASLAAALLLTPAPFAQVSEAPKPKPEEFPAFETAIEGLTKVVSTNDGAPGLYDLYSDKKTGRLVAVLPAGFEAQELMIACTITSGDPEAGVMGPTHYGSWRRIGKQLAFLVPNVNVRSEGDERTKAAVSNLYSASVLLSVPILALEGGSRPAIDLGKLAVSEVPRLFGGPNGGYGPSITGLQAPLATLTKAKAFPENVVVEFEAPETGGRLVRVAYSIGKLEGTPGFQPREADPRVGYYYDWHVDTTTGDFDAEPKRYINRWHVVKADPALSLSPPAQPIVWYVEHTTPIKYRRWVKNGILFWNQAFEKVGITGALEVYQQDAATGAHMDKDPEDARYNFFRWNMSEAGYAIGPSRSNPKTGEILEADVVWNQGLTRAVGSMLGTLSRTLLADSSGPELLAWFEQNPGWDPRLRFAGFDGPAAAAAPVVATRESLLAKNGAKNSACRMGGQLSVDLSLAGLAFAAGMIELESESELDGVPEEFLGPMIRYISAHEVGHCLGLQHNMAASTSVSQETMNAPGYDGPVSASVMDYVAPNLACGESQGPFINGALGAYDIWAIACGYGPEPELTANLAKSSQPEHLYVCQAAMSTSSDPRNQTWEVGANNLDFCESRMKLVSELRAKLVSEVVKDGESYALVRRRYQQLLGTQLRTLVIAAGWIGGAYESNDFKGTPEARVPVVDVAPADQRRALALLMANAFDERAFGLTPELVSHMGKEYWWDPNGLTELIQDTSYSVHDLVGGYQAMGLSLLLNPVRLRRVHDAEFRTQGTPDAFTLAELLGRVTDSVWSECLAPDQARRVESNAVESSAKIEQPFCSSFRRNLQFEHASRLVDLVLVGDTQRPALRAIATLATAELRRIGDLLAKADQPDLDPATRAHFAELRVRIQRALDAAYVRKG